MKQPMRPKKWPGVRIRGAVVAAKWAFLDDPALQDKLVDYADKTQVKVTLHLPAIHCVACVWLLENLFRLKSGIGQSQVNFPRKEIAIAFNPAEVKLSEVVALLASLGYEPARDELVEVVRLLEQGGLDLDDSLALWERGEALARRCEEHLAGARQRVERALAAADDA